MRPIRLLACPLQTENYVPRTLQQQSSFVAFSLTHTRSPCLLGVAGTQRVRLNAHRYPDAINPQETPSLQRCRGEQQREILSSSAERRSLASYDLLASRLQFPSCQSRHSTAQLCHGT